MKAKFKIPYAKKPAKSTLKKPYTKNAHCSVVPRTVKGNSSPNYAVVTESITRAGSAPNTAPGFNTFFLNSAESIRAYEVAVNFQEYRLAKVRFTYMPRFNVYQETSTTSATVPQLWLKRFPAGIPETALLTGGIDVLASLGIKPLKFTRNITIQYKPNLCQSALIVQSSPSITTDIKNITPIWNKWLSTSNLDSADTTRPLYMGHLDWIQQESAVSLAIVYDVSVEYVWEFRKPAVVTIFNPGSPSANVKPTNNSATI